MTSLFTQQEKLAAGASSSIRTRVEGQPETWAQQALSDLYEEHPYTAEYSPSIDVVRMDPDRGYMLAYITVSSGDREAKIPVVIQDHQLLPYATFASGEYILPLSEERLTAEMLTGPEESAVRTTDRELEEMMRDQEMGPPDSSSWMGNRSVLSKLSWAHMDDFQKFMDTTNKEVYAGVRERISQLEKKAQPLSDGVTPQDIAKHHDTVMIEADPYSSRYKVTSASSRFIKSAHTQTVLRPKATAIFPPEVLNEVSKKGYAIIGGPKVKLAEETQTESKVVDRPGIWSVKTKTGISMTGSVIPNVVDFDGKPLPLCMFYNGAAAAVQDTVAGVCVAELRIPPTEARSSGESAFIFRDASGAVRITLPFVLQSEQPCEYGQAMVVESYLGDVVKLVRAEAEQLARLDASTYMIPARYSLVNIGHPENRVELVDMPEDFDAFQKMGHHQALEIVGNGLYDLKGGDVDLRGLGDREAEFMLTTLGAPEPHRLLKAADAFGSTRLYGPSIKDGTDQVLSKIHTMEKHAQSVCSEWRQDTAALVNLAAWMLNKPNMEKVGEIPTESVDNVLSLGFIRPENTKTYVDSLGDLEDTTRKLASLVLASQLGYTEIPTDDAINAMEGMEKVLEGLRRLKAEIE